MSFYRNFDGKLCPFDLIFGQFDSKMRQFDPKSYDVYICLFDDYMSF